MFVKPPMYDELEPNLDMLQDALEENLEISSNGKAIDVSLLSPELRLLSTIMLLMLILRSPVERRSPETWAEKS